MTEEQLVATLRKVRGKQHLAPHGDVTTVKVHMRTLLGADADLCQRIEEYVICWSIMLRWVWMWVWVCVRAHMRACANPCGLH